MYFMIALIFWGNFGGYFDHTSLKIYKKKIRYFVKDKLIIKPFKMKRICTLRYSFIRLHVYY